MALVSLINITPDAERTMAYLARVSSPHNQGNEGTAAKLLGYCAKQGHWSVFEMAHATFEITTSRAISAQILRHKSFSYQEHSLRYSEVVGIEEYPARRQDTKNRQNSIDDMDPADKLWFKVAQREVANLARQRYSEALSRGVAKEQARFLLPLAATTKLYMSGSIRSWVHYLEVRCDPATQLEHREIALAIRDELSRHLPAVSEALGWNTANT